jgi:hypothetical protein
MPKPAPNDRRTPAKPSLSPEKYARLKAEAEAPFRGMRQFFYLAFGASGTIGAFIFLTQAIAGRDVEHALPNLALQLGLVGLMVFLFRLEGRGDRSS